MNRAGTNRRAVLSAGVMAGLGLLLRGDSAAQAARFPHIDAAIHELADARRELERADHDFGGHRVEAIRAIDAAIVQLKLAWEYAERHRR